MKSPAQRCRVRLPFLGLKGLLCRVSQLCGIVDLRRWHTPSTGEGHLELPHDLRRKHVGKGYTVFFPRKSNKYNMEDTLWMTAQKLWSRFEIPHFPKPTPFKGPALAAVRFSGGCWWVEFMHVQPVNLRSRNVLGHPTEIAGLIMRAYENPLVSLNKAGFFSPWFLEWGFVGWGVGSW